RIDVGDGRDEGGPEHREGRAQSTAAEQRLERRDAGLAGLDREGLDRRHAASTCIALASTDPSTWVLRPTRTKSGPSNGCRSTRRWWRITSSAPRRPRSVRRTPW